MLDFDLAVMYRVETRVLNEAVKRNIKRFPLDFMFQLTDKEWQDMSSLPYAFTEQGVAMLSGLLNSDIAIEMNIRIMRAFVALRNILSAAKEEDKLLQLIQRIEALEEVSEETFADSQRPLRGNKKRIG